MATSLHEDGLISKTKSMILSFCGIISKPSSKLETPEGLKTLINPKLETLNPNPLIIHSYSRSTNPHVHSSISPSAEYSQSLSTHSSTFSSWSFGMDDMLGTESGVYMMSSNALKMPEMDPTPNDNKRKRRERKMAMKKKEYPPPIPLLSRTGNLTCYMPWLLKRHYKNGRLVLTEEKRKHHEYFEAYRDNGRLVLELVSLDDTFTCCHSVREEEEEEEEEELEKVDEETEEADDDDNGGNEYKGSSIPIPLMAFSVPKFYHGNQRYGDPRLCLTYSGTILSESISPSIFCNGGRGHDQKEQGNSAPFSFYNILSSTTTHTQLPVM